MSDSPTDDVRSGPGSAAAGIPPSSAAADDFQPDVPAEPPAQSASSPQRRRPDSAREPVAFDAPREPEPDSVPAELQLVPGASIADGRYRLLIFHGGASALQFWQALDTALDRQVALTFVDPDGTLPTDEVSEILSRTMRLSRFDLPGIARVLDVVHTATGGLVVAEWIRGGSLQEVADTAPSPAGAARAVQSLAAAAAAAHDAGVTLSIDQPSRVRVSIDGDVALAFPATLPDARPEDDLRGIGAALYALLVNRWPLPMSGTHNELQPAERDASGRPLEPRDIDGDIPFQISAAAAHSISDDGSIRSAATLLNLLEQAPVAAEPTDLLSPIAESEPAATRRRPRPAPTDDEQARRRRGMLIAAGAGIGIIVVALIAAKLLVGGTGSGRGGLADILGARTSSSAATDADGPTQPGNTVKPVKVAVFPPDNDGDAPADAAKAIDGNRSTAWPTDTYDDAVPFPAFKEGVGLLLQLPQPTVVGTVTIDISSTGTKVEIRSSATANPTKLSDTTALTPVPVSLHRGENRIDVPAGAATSTLLVWITTLGQTDGKSQADVREITVQAAG